MEIETGGAVGTNRWRTATALSILCFLAVSSIGLYLFARDPYSESEIRRLIDEAYRTQRPGGGRLFKAAYFSLSDVPPRQPDLGKAQILLLRYPESETRRQLQGLIYLASGNWQKYVDLAVRFSPETRLDAAVLNNL